MTSGYNSDAVSDHEYENIQMVSCRDACPAGKLQHAAEKDKAGSEAEEGEEREDGEEEEDNYVILRAVTENQDSSDSGHWVRRRLALTNLFIFSPFFFSFYQFSL